MAISLKLVVVGDGGCGKSSITTRFLRREFSEEWDPTIEDSYQTTLTVDGTEFSIEIVDTAGQEEYRGLWGEQTVRSADAFVVAYAIDSPTSFELLSSFLHTIRKVKSPDEVPSEENTPENTPFTFCILGNKCDKRDERVITSQQGLAFARASGGLFFECSAKERVNIDAAFESLIRAAAKSKLQKADWLKRYRQTEDDHTFNGNVGMLEKVSLSTSGKARVGNGEGGWEAEKPRKRNPNLAMDRNKTQSFGGLGREEKEESGCCGGCVVA